MPAGGSGRSFGRMFGFGIALYAILALLVLMFLRRARGRTFDDILARSEAEHHQVHRVHDAHPLGGTWKQFWQWLREENR